MSNKKPPIECRCGKSAEFVRRTFGAGQYIADVYKCECDLWQAVTIDVGDTGATATHWDITITGESASTSAQEASVEGTREEAIAQVVNRIFGCAAELTMHDDGKGNTGFVLYDNDGETFSCEVVISSFPVPQ